MKSDKTLKVIALVSLIIATMFPVTVYAHPPKDLQLVYDMSKKSLTVTIIHPSFLPSAHYVKLVTVKKNGSELNTYHYKSQPDKNTFTYAYEIPASPGDTLEVTAECNMFGSKSAQVKVGELPVSSSTLGK